MTLRIAPVLFLLALPIACGPRPLASESLLANPKTIDFGKRPLFSTSQVGLALRNLGSEPLANLSFVVVPSTFSVQPAPTPLEPLNIQSDESIALVLTFTPMTTGQQDGILRISTQDPEDTGLAVLLRGFADGFETGGVADAGSPCCFDGG